MRPTPAITERLALVTSNPSDIVDHIPTLVKFGSMCDHITEFGVRTGTSASAWLAAYPTDIALYDIENVGCIPELRKLATDADINLTFNQRDTGLTPMDCSTDLLFIDTRHCFEQAWKELMLNHSRVRRFIILHDTEIYGWNGDDGKSGLKRAMMEFMCTYPDWRIIQHSQKCYGLTVLGRLAIDLRHMTSYEPCRP